MYEKWCVMHAKYDASNTVNIQKVLTILLTEVELIF